MPSVRVRTALVALVAAACRHGDAPAASKTGLAASSDPAPSASPPRPRYAPLVTLDGTAAPAPPEQREGGRRVHGKAHRAWIHAAPRASAPRLGYLRAGGSVQADAEPAGTEGCPGGWYRVQPRGFVCVGRTATLDAADPVVALTAPHPPDHARKLPYVYGTVRRPGPVYARLPSPDELARAEPDLDQRMAAWLAADGEIGAGYAQHVWLGRPGDAPDPRYAWETQQSDPLPPLLAGTSALPGMGGKQRQPAEIVLERMKPRVGYAFLHTFLHQGRRWGLSASLELLPTDRLRPIQGSDFHGVEIGKQVDFPFALVRQPGARLWLWQQSSKKLIDAGEAPYRAAYSLSSKQQFFDGMLHYQTREGKWLSDRDASRLDPAKRMPGWGKKGEKWIDVNLTKQTLVLYEGTRPVYATLISSGEAGLQDAAHTTATKRGIFRIHTKHLTTTMSSAEVGEEFELREVPYVQYFDKEGYALHGAYWHDRFGIPKSHGCINLAPEDARRIFYWTEPQVPPGWHGVMLPLEGTVMFVHP
jgi:hypothetical protein